jgi:hypothetical protein
VRTGREGYPWGTMKLAPILLVALTVAVPATAAAQKSDSAGTAAAECAGQKVGAVVFNETFSSPADFGRVLLCAGSTYRGETNHGGVRLSARSMLPGVQSPRITELLGGSASAGPGGGGGMYKFQAFADGVYEIGVNGVQAGASVNLKIVRTK